MLRYLSGWILKVRGDEKGQTLTEYGLILVLIAVVVILMVKGLGGTVNTTYSTINSALP